MAPCRLYDPTVDEFGEDGYPLAWHQEIKDFIRDEAGYRCVRCQHPYMKGDGEWSTCNSHCHHTGPFRILYDDGRTNPVTAPTSERAVEVFDWLVNRGDEPPGVVQAQWRILTVHHLDGNKANCRWWNLAALCQRCHLTIQGRVVMARVWPWEHTEWFKPYVAGFYAFSYLHEDLDRPDIEARLEELLNLERMTA